MNVVCFALFLDCEGEGSAKVAQAHGIEFGCDGFGAVDGNIAKMSDLEIGVGEVERVDDFEDVVARLQNFDFRFVNVSFHVDERVVVAHRDGFGLTGIVIVEVNGGRNFVCWDDGGAVIICQSATD